VRPAAGAAPAPLAARTPLVVVGDDWGRHVSTLQHVVRALLPRHPTVWVNSFGHRLPRLTRYDAARALGKVAAMVGAGRAVPSELGRPAAVIEPRALPWHHIPAIHAANMASLRHAIRRRLRALAPGERPVLISSTPVAEGLIGGLGEQLAIYFVIDDYLELPYVTPGLIAPLEARMLEKVDAVVATAQALVERKRPRSHLAFHLPQGANYEHFAVPRPVPPELGSLPRPLLGFAGGVSECLDVPLVRALAHRFPAASVVLVGPVSIDTNTLALPNVHILGNRAYADLPAYVQAFDVGLIPYILNDWTRSVDPLKLLEYLAAGLPVISTGLPEAEKHRPMATVVPGGSEWLDAVAAALRERSDAARARRQAYAATQSWAVRASRFEEILADVAAATAR
jgi:glycosyltransferase involved in cell wall biosynthesis